MTSAVGLRDVTEADLPVFFDHQRDPVAIRMVAFTYRDPADRAAFMAHWTKILGDDTIVKKSILFQGQVVGNIVCFEWAGKPEVGYWIDRHHWGKGLASMALSAFLGDLKARPLYVSAAKDNAASLRVLEKCGFTVSGYQKAFANARGEEIEEVMLVSVLQRRFS